MCFQGANYPVSLSSTFLLCLQLPITTVEGFCVHQVVYGNSSAVDGTVSKLSTLAMLINYALKRLKKDMPNIYLALGFLFWVHDLLFTVKGVQKTKLIKILI